MTTEREALISAMRMYKAAYPDSEHFGKVSDMLAADAQQVPMTEEEFSGVWAATIFDDATEDTFEHGVSLLRKIEAHHGIKPQGDSNARKVD